MFATKKSKDRASKNIKDKALSAALIIDSDSSNEDNTTTALSKRHSSIIARIKSTSSPQVKLPESPHKSTKSSKPPPKRAIPPTFTPSSTSGSEEEDSSSDKSKLSTEHQNKTPKSSQKSTTSLPSSQLKGLALAANTKPPPKSKNNSFSSVQNQSSESGSEESSDGEESETRTTSEEESEEGSKEESEKRSKSKADLHKTIPLKIVSPLSPHRYKVPNSFRFASIPTPTSSDLRSLYSTSSHADKQIWHLIMPSSIPISLLTNNILQNTATGDVTLSYNGCDYGFVSGSKISDHTEHFLVPSPKEDEYSTAQNRISRTLHLQQLINLPAISKVIEESQNELGISRIPDTSLHKQPKGLKMRNWLIGVSELGNFRSCSSSSEDEGPQFRPPLGLTQTSEKKRKAKCVGIEKAQGSPIKKKRKKARNENLAVKEPVIGLSNASLTYSNKDSELQVNEAEVIMKSSNPK